jgi:hypothetical protein
MAKRVFAFIFKVHYAIEKRPYYYVIHYIK